MTFQSVAGIIAGILGILAYPAYIWDMRSADVRPNRATWLIWAVVNWVIALSYDKAGAEWTSISTYAFAVGATVLGIVSFVRGEGGASRFDFFCLALGAISITLLIFSRSPLPALVLSLTANGIGTLPTLRKLYLRTWRESVLAYTLWIVCNITNFTVAISTPAQDLTGPKVVVVVPTIFYVVQCTTVISFIMRTRKTKL